MTHLLDTSALLVHYLDEPGAEKVDALLAQGPDKIALAAPTWAELDRRLVELVPDTTEAARVFRLYTQTLCALIPLDEKATLAAIRLRRNARERLPLVDALIAGCAAANGLILVHRDPHLGAIPTKELKTLRLPDKLRGDSE